MNEMLAFSRDYGQQLVKALDLERHHVRSIKLDFDIEEAVRVTVEFTATEKHIEALGLKT